MPQVELTEVRAGICTGVFYTSFHDAKASLTYYGYNRDDDLRNIVKKSTIMPVIQSS